MLIQLQFLNFILMSKDFSIILENNITADYFPNYSAEFNFIYFHFKKYNQTPDLATFVATFPDFEVMEVTEPADYLLSELYKNKNEVFVANTFNKVKSLLLSGKSEEAISLFSTSANSLASQKHLNAVNILEDTSRYDAYIDKCNDFSKYYISTGFKELDKIIGGWDRNEELAVVAARSGIGKSWMLLKFITEAVKAGLTVGLFSGEMSVNKVAYRFDTLMSHISNGKLTHGNISISNQYKAYLDDLKTNHSGSLYVMTRDMVDGSCGVNALRGFVEKYNLDILFIDQLSLLDDDQRAKQPFEKAANISKDLKILQVTKHIPIISVSQQNRTAVEEGQFAGTENIAQSDRIAQDATLILFLTVKDDILTMSIGKARDGGTGELLKYEIDIDKGHYNYISEDTEEQSEHYVSYNSDVGDNVFA